ncbi:DUF1345 domain-containing protein [Microbacterium sp. CJ88]|uniref:DUF1345 domain-containing protein n=1 Tax=Microbacterium sp. CJ88 TaxID=3445672 RepID=UPI003F6597AD
MVTAVVVRAVDLLVQLALIWLGVLLIIAVGDSESMVDYLLAWCALGSVYWLASVIAVAVSVRRGGDRVPRWVQHLDGNRIVGWISQFATFFSSLVGLIAVALILVLRNDPAWRGFIEFVAVYAMLLSWALFHWGYARIYDRAHRRAVAAGGTSPLLFPGQAADGTPAARLVDFVYFAFTNATAFSVSDVQVMTSRMRWTVIWHTTISFFLNALIIVFAFSTIING